MEGERRHAARQIRSESALTGGAKKRAIAARLGGSGPPAGLRVKRGPEKVTKFDFRRSSSYTEKKKRSSVRALFSPLGSGPHNYLSDKKRRDRRLGPEGHKN